MSSEGIKKEEVTASKAKETVDSGTKGLKILVTDIDKYGSDITAMSNFFDGYILQLTQELSANSVTDVIANIPIADFSIINDVVQHADLLMKGENSYIPDFNSLPNFIKRKLSKGIYKVGESRQVDGNMRAVIVDEGGDRVKDVTLKQVRNDPGTLATTRNIANQLQMRQLAAKLDDIQELQSYQIDRDRDRDIVIPFLNARDYILRVQNQEYLGDKMHCLLEASDALTTAINATYTDINTVSNHLAKMTSRPIFQNRKQILNYMGFLASDLQVATKYVGVQMHILDYLGDSVGAKQVSERYQHVLQDFFTKKIGQKQQSPVMLLHMNYPYNNDNRNSWYNLQKEMAQALQANTLFPEDKPIYLVSVEDVEDVK